LVRRRTTYDAYLKSQTEDSEKQARLAAAEVTEINGLAKKLLGVASYQSLAARWKTSQKLIIVGGILAGAGIALFAWAAHPPEDAKASLATPNVLTSPTQKTLSLSPAGRDALDTALGAACKTADLITVEVLATTDAGPDVLVNQQGCARIRVLLGPSWGVVR
jgi:hypothetical protein